MARENMMKVGEKSHNSDTIQAFPNRGRNSHLKRTQKKWTRKDRISLN